MFSEIYKRIFFLLYDFALDPYLIFHWFSIVGTANEKKRNRKTYRKGEVQVNEGQKTETENRKRKVKESK